MKGFLVLLCCLVAVQARSTAVRSTNRELAILGENPWLVHLRVAVSTSGYLESGAGTLISEGFVLTARDLVETARFVWVRYGVTTVWNPSLVTEVSNANVILDAPAAVALLRINRVVQTESFIAPLPLSREEVSGLARQCGFGATLDGQPGETLWCEEASFEKDGDKVLTQDAAPATRYDLGAPLVANDVLVGVLVNYPQGYDDDFSAEYVATESFIDWVEEQIE